MKTEGSRDSGFADSAFAENERERNLESGPISSGKAWRLDWGGLSFQHEALSGKDVGAEKFEAGGTQDWTSGIFGDVEITTRKFSIQ